MRPFRIASFAGAGLAAALAAGVVMYVGGGDSAAASAGPGAAMPTSIANCIVDARNDVIIGGSGANPDCRGDVAMIPDPNAYYREILVKDGGKLLISAGAGGANVAKEPPVGILCIADGGTVRAGTADDPVDNRHRFRMTFVGTSKDKDDTPQSPCYGFSKGIDVTAGGSLLLFGGEGVPSRCDPNDGSKCEVSWTTLAEPAGKRVAGAKFEPPAAGTTTLHLSADVGAGPNPWQQGDWVVVATTSYVPFDSEFVQIKDVKPGAGHTSIVELEPGTPLKYYHFGSLAPSPATATCPDPLYPAHSATATQPAFLCDGPLRNYGVDERAEVGLVSRDIELTARTSGDTDHWGGEIKIHAGFARIVLQGVRLSKFGKDHLGSYPIHFHLVGDAGGKPIVDADSVDHSYNKCVTIHSTSNLAIRNLVCARIVGHIYYEELQDANAANPADDSGLVFDHDLGIGAMSNRFDIYGNAKKSRDELINEFWWAGDYMTNQECATLGTCIDYHAFNIPDTDNWRQSVHGGCVRYHPGNTGGLEGNFQPNAGSTTAACPPAPPADQSYTIYIEPAMGFWIQNPRTVLENDAIAGCQGVGKGFEWLSPVGVQLSDGTTEDPKYFPLGRVYNDRASACYSGFYDEEEYTEKGDQLFPHEGGIQDAPSVVATLDGITATRNRFRGAWLRPTWFVIRDGHFASNRENVTLVTSGGIDGNAPGVWELLEDSVLEGLSENNVDRWGPCPQQNVWGVANTGEKFGCVASTPPPAGTNPHSGEEIGQGYEDPGWNDFGYMLYDGPVRLVHDRFVNFNYNTAWTKDKALNDQLQCSGDGWAFNAELDDRDCAFLKFWSRHTMSKTRQGPPTPYEGDAALGWFQSNQSAYPTATASKELLWENTNLRHQIYTKVVSLSLDFNDGDKNTAIIDEDGTLSGMGVKPTMPGLRPQYPISLNNLPFNAPFATSANRATAVDECLSRGGQNMAFEGRDSSLMSPAAMGTLEFSDLFPFYINVNNLNPPDNEYPGDASSHWQNMTFRRDDAVPDGKGETYHPDMVMQTGRNGLGIWEPKVINGYGYTVKVARTTAPAAPPKVLAGGRAGIWRWIEVGLADVVDPNIRPGHPFYIRLGIDYMDKNGDHPPDKSYFKVTRGYKSYEGSNIWEQDPELLKYWTKLDCRGLDSQNKNNVPYEGHDNPACPAGAKTPLTPVDSIGELTKPDGSPDLDVFYYDSATGYLYLNVAQDERNPVAPSPTGSCDPQEDGGNADPSCPHTDSPEYETYYACPKAGCIIYSIEVESKSAYTYTPGPSSSNLPATADEKAPPPLDQQNKLLDITTNPPELIDPVLRTDLAGDPYYKAANPPQCDATQPPPSGP